MPLFQLPAPIIHLIDLRVKTIASVDFRGLRKEGFNAVVIDKDNCLTLPEKDELFPPLKEAWSRLLAAFPPGRVLVVSNSAGTRKDPGGIAAEHVALQLRCPVLLHAKPKPACSDQILKYFRGELGTPRTLQSTLKRSADKFVQEEKADEQILVDKWLKEVDGPICGPPRPSERRADDFADERMDPARRKALDDAWNTPLPPRHAPLPPVPTPEPTPAPAPEPPLRILVIGDRLFTDTLLAHRMRLHLGAPDALTSERVISIHTTQLPQPRDMRLLRWIENRLAGGPMRLRETSTDWGRFALAEQSDTSPRGDGTAAAASVGLVQSLRNVPPLTLSPSSWKPLPLLFGAGRGVALVLVFSGRLLVRGFQWAWERIRLRTVQTKAVVVEEIKQERKLDAAP